MPYKKTIMPYLDQLDELATKLGACNCVYAAPDGTLHGSNTDWKGVEGCLRNANSDGRGKPALVIGAGGASRAAVYALFAELDCDTIYIINRDEVEVADLLHDAKAYSETRQPRLIHVKTVEQAAQLERPFYIVGTVPDFEPRSEQELNARAILENFLGRAEKAKGVLLDMCYKPRKTRILALGRKHGWRLVEGTEIIGYQFETQWKFWTSGESNGKMPGEEMWKLLRQKAEESTAINF